MNGFLVILMNGFLMFDRLHQQETVSAIFCKRWATFMESKQYSSLSWKQTVFKPKLKNSMSHKCWHYRVIDFFPRFNRISHHFCHIAGDLLFRATIAYNCHRRHWTIRIGHSASPFPIHLHFIWIWAGLFICLFCTHCAVNCVDRNVSHFLCTALESKSKSCECKMSTCYSFQSAILSRDWRKCFTFCVECYRALRCLKLSTIRVCRFHDGMRVKCAVSSAIETISVEWKVF